MKTLTRRSLLKNTAGLVASTVSAAYVVPSSALGKDGATAPSERLTMGAIGLGGQGMHNLRNFLTCDDLRMLAVCDVDTDHRLAAKKAVDSAYGNNDCAAYNDFREIFIRDDIDTVLIATPDHWHAVISIEAAKAGKDIYCEKPISLTIAEGRAVADTVKRLGTVYQSGTQRRSIGCFRFAVDIARSGMLGELRTLHCYYHNGPTCPPQKPQPVPKGFDYDRWLGPAPFEAYTPRRCHGSFRWLYDYSGGQLTDLGAHFNDLAQWANGSQYTGPIEYEGRAEFPKDGLFNTPVRFKVVAKYADGVEMIYHDETEPGRGPRGNKFVGTEGWVSVDDTGKITASSDAIMRKVNVAQRGYAYMMGHHRNFLDCVKTRSLPISNAEVSHRSVTTCHAGNICLRLGHKLRWDPDNERFLDDDEANRMLARAMRSPWRL
ncbi:MAG: Gfo/Idh/MocA family oxidoreductase [Phycisphaerales bacterium]|nr:MAG: Gfo/Idh/MocA family oxidoreductase [Phycisphaerales bacterium]